jgi:DNA-binding protein H-NS
MTQSYSQIQKKIETLQRQADQLRNKEIQGVVARIKTAIAHYGLSAAQLGFTGSAARGKSAGKRGSAAGAKFGDGGGNYWSGRGPRPHWLRDALKAGRTLDEFALGASPAAAATPVGTPSKKKAKGPQKRRPSSVLYRDDAGHSWTGRGPRPQWLKDAIAGGKTLEELAG